MALTVNGSDFSAQSQVEFTANNVPTLLTTIFVSQSQLSASIPASLLQAPGILKSRLQTHRVKIQPIQLLLQSRLLLPSSAQSHLRAPLQEA